MNPIRKRAKDHLPTVLLTLLSIVQALALELLWSHLRAANYIFELSWLAFISWAQIAATFLGIVLIWIVYVSNVVRFRWVPTTSDSVYPFLIGLLEFMLIETLGPDDMGLWFICMALIFGLMTWVAQMTMRRARLDGENDAFFGTLEPAELRDFYPAIGIVCGLALAGAYLLTSGDRGILVMFALLATNFLLAWQFYRSALFWNRSVSEESSPDLQGDYVSAPISKSRRDK